MLHKDTFSFLKELSKNNNREWFIENKTKYDEIKLSLEKFVEELILQINTFDKNLGHPNPKKIILRIYRDVRFSEDKTPYKNYVAAMICPEKYKKTCDYASYYLHIENNKSFISSGIYMPSSAVLRNIRKNIYEYFDEFRDIVEDNKFISEFGNITDIMEKLQRVPNGFDKTHISSEYLKLKCFYVSHNFKNEEIIKETLLKNSADIYKKSLPLKNWINQIIEG